MNPTSILAPQVCRASLLVASTLALSTAMARTEPVTEEQAHAIGVDAYLYFYSPITMDVTRKQLSNVEPGKEIWRADEHFRERSGLPDRRRSSSGPAQLRHALFLRV